MNLGKHFEGNNKELINLDGVLRDLDKEFRNLFRKFIVEKTDFLTQKVRLFDLKSPSF